MVKKTCCVKNYCSKRKGCGPGRNKCCGKKVEKVDSCLSWITTRNNFNIGISKKIAHREYLIMLSGNYKGLIDEDKDELPDWVAISNRPNRTYSNLSTQTLVNLWRKEKKCLTSSYDCCKPCYDTSSFDVLAPNAYLNFKTINATNLSCAFQIKDIHVDHNGVYPILVLKIKCLREANGKVVPLDCLQSRIYDVSLTIESIGTSLLKNRNTINKWSTYKEKNLRGDGPTNNSLDLVDYGMAASPPCAACGIGPGAGLGLGVEGDLTCTRGISISDEDEDDNDKLIKIDLALDNLDKLNNKTRAWKKKRTLK